MHVLRTYVPRATVPCMVARAAPGGGQTGRVGQASREEEAGVWAGAGVVAEIVGGLGGWMDGARVAGGRARGVWAVLMAQSGTCSEAAHSLPHVKDRVHSLHSPAGRGPGGVWCHQACQ